MEVANCVAAKRFGIGVVPLVFGSTVGANILTMSLANFLELKTPYISILFFGTFLLTALLQIASGVTLPLLTRREIVVGACFAIVLFLPRLCYMYEGWLGYAINFACFDDRGHIQELASIIHTDRFPPLSTFDGSRYLSFYYAPWVLGAALYWTGLLVTVKQALGLTILIYQLFFSYSLLYASKILFTERKLGSAFLILCVLYGGFDFLYWLSGLSLIPSHSEWWATEFGFRLQFSNFFTLALWVPHHFMAALSVLFGLYAIQSSTRITAQVLAGLFFAFATFSSVFVVVGSLFLVCWAFVGPRYLRSIPIVLVSFLISCAPLWWIYIGKADVGFTAFGALDQFWLEHKRAAFLVFILVIFLELMPLAAAAVYSSTRQRKLVWLVAPALSYLVSTFFIAYSGANNYALRGSIVPIFTLTYAATPYVLSFAERVPRAWLTIAAVCYLSGGILEYMSFSFTAFRALGHSDTTFNRRVLAENSLRNGFTSVRLVEEAAQYPEGWYLLERPIRQPKTPPEAWNMELLNSDNRYRITLSRMLGLANAGTQSGAACGCDRSEPLLKP